MVIFCHVCVSIRPSVPSDHVLPSKNTRVGSCTSTARWKGLPPDLFGTCSQATDSTPPLVDNVVHLVLDGPRYLAQKLVAQLASLEVQAARLCIQIELGAEKIENSICGHIVIKIIVPAGILQRCKTLASGMLGLGASKAKQLP